jgi:hypothetical protein
MQKRKIKATIKYSKKVAQKLTDTRYYRTQSQNMKKYEFMEAEKTRLSTRGWKRVTDILEGYKKLEQEGYESSAARVLKGIYNKNVRAALNKRPVLNQNLLSVVAAPEVLLLAYREIRGNKGALTPGASKDGR